MKYLQTQWKPRLAIIVTVSIVISVFMVSLEMTDWAAQINLQGYSHGDGEAEGPGAASILRYILPFVKELILIGVPMAIALLLMKIFGRKKRTQKIT